MKVRPKFEVLRLLDPPMQGANIEWLRRRINASKYVLPKVIPDGVFGPHTAHEAKQLLYRLGHPNPVHAVSIEDWGHIWRWTKFGGAFLPPAWVKRAAERRAKGYGNRLGITTRSWYGLHPELAPPPPVKQAIRIYSRDELGLKPPKAVTKSTGAYGLIIVDHWMGPGSGAEGLAAAMAQWRAWQLYHMYGPGHDWNDIGYNFGIPRGCDVGVVFEGRGFGVRGAHCNNNIGNGYLGINLMFGVDDGTPDRNQLLTLELFLREIKTQRVTGHNEWSASACPGPAMKAWNSNNRKGV